MEETVSPSFMYAFIWQRLIEYYIRQALGWSHGMKNSILEVTGRLTGKQVIRIFTTFYVGTFSQSFSNLYKNPYQISKFPSKHTTLSMLCRRGTYSLDKNPFFCHSL